MNQRKNFLNSKHSVTVNLILLLMFKRWTLMECDDNILRKSLICSQHFQISTHQFTRCINAIQSLSNSISYFII